MLLALASPSPAPQWTVIRPNPAPRLLVLEQCVEPERCYPTVMRPDGQATGSLRTTFRITNRSAQNLDVQFRFTVWETQ